MKTGLIVYGKNQADNSAIGELSQSEDFDFHCEWDPKEGHWFFEEEPESIYKLEDILVDIFHREGISCRFKAQGALDEGEDLKKAWWDDNQDDLVSAVRKMIPDQRVSALMDAGMSHDEAEMECEGTPRHIAMTLWSLADTVELEGICSTFSSPVDEKKVMNFHRFVESKQADR
jgi:hypothetical protein